ncbi:MAG: hypothetical protein U0791_13875 [Gemmataceae bacterium]
MRDRPAFDLFVISWLVLFLELACIRWFPSHVMFLTFFTNIVLLACFVGMSVGCLAARNPTRYLNRTPLWIVLGLVIGLVVENNRGRLGQIVAVGDRSNPDVIFFGVEAGDTLDLPFRIPVEVLAGAFFLLIGVILVGPGQEMGRAFNRVSSRTRAYGANLLGSLAGIGSFAACSYLALPPIVWFGTIAAVLGWLLLRGVETPTPSKRTIIAFLIAMVALSGVTSGFFRVHSRDVFWSPYYRIDYHDATREIGTNLVGHQIIEPRGRVPWTPHANYAIPYLMQRDLTGTNGKPAWSPFKRILIIGAGSGNDVSRALQWLPPDAIVDAVEIDPVIQAIGAKHHPDQPYADPRVRVHLNDGRNFLRRSPAETYDLVIFALVDSLVLQLGSGNMRLESYLFTLESFQDARRVLKPTGVCAVYNYFRHGWLACRLNQELSQVFGTPPAVFVIGDNPVTAIKLSDSELDAFTVFLCGAKDVLDPLRLIFRSTTYRYRGDRPPAPTPAGEAFVAKVPVRADMVVPGLPAEQPPLADAASLNPRWVAKPWLEIRPIEVEPLGSLPLATDDWPFLYVKEPGIPLVTWRGMALMVALSFVLWFVFRARTDPSLARPANETGLAVRSFFLGAGFMLVETKAVVQMALLFGSTWMVNTVVFAAILVMSLAGTLFVAKFKPKRLEPYYIGLFLAAGLGIVIPLNTLLGMGEAAQISLSCLLVFAPIVFAGVIFTTTFARSSQPDRVFGANVAGALLGGIAENASVLLGFQYLLCVAIGFYALSAMAGNGRLASDRETSVL